MLEYEFMKIIPLTVLLIILILSSFTLGAVPVPGVDISPFGAQTVWPVNSDLETILDRMQEGKIQWGRFDLCWWGLCETVKGEYNFTHPNVPGWENWNTDRAISLMHQRGIEPFPILCYGNELYDNGQGPFSDEGCEAFGNYCFAAADRYTTSVTYWEIWNEPNLEFFWGRPPDAEDYAKLVKVAAARIRQANPRAVIAGGVTSGIDFAFLETCFQNGLLDAVDAITVHPYRFTMPESINGEIATLRSKIASYTDRSIPIWSGEWGYNTYLHKMSEKSQAKSLARMMVNNLSQAIGLSIWFSTHAFPEHSGEIHDPEWGLLDYDYNPRPSFYAMRTVNERLAARVHHIADPFNIALTPPLWNRRIEVFERGDSEHRTIALWLERWPPSDSFTGEVTRVSLTVPGDAAFHAYDGLTGESIVLDVSRNGNRAELNNFHVLDYPVYVEVDLMPVTPALMTGFMIH